MDRCRHSRLFFSLVRLGDFNATLRCDERSPEGRTSFSFQEWVRTRGLIDLGFNGPRFTWNHGNDANQMRSVRLDRALWHTLAAKIPQSSGLALPTCILRSLRYPTQHVRKQLECGVDRPSCFEVVWLSHRDFQKSTKENWSKGRECRKQLRILHKSSGDGTRRCLVT